MLGTLKCSNKIASQSSSVFKEGEARLVDGISQIDSNLSVRGEKIAKAEQNLAELKAEQEKDLANRAKLNDTLKRVQEFTF